jgi:large subunit ribosomal protein L32
MAAGLPFELQNAKSHSPFNIYYSRGVIIMPNPKRRHSHARTRERRAHDALRAPQTVVCENCQEPRMPHRVCAKCGYYNGRQVVKVQQEA